MRLGRYAVSWESLLALARLARDAARVRAEGIPRVQGESPADVARAVLRANAREVLSAGAGHFHPMWVADFGKAFGGALLALDRAYLAALVSRIIRTSARVGHVPTCFTARGHHDAPWPRADNLPWLLHMVDRLADPELVATHERDLAKAHADWTRAHVDPATGLVAERVVGDWMDTVPRPSSTYNNLCALRAFEVADRLDLDEAPTFGPEASRALLETRWTGTHLRDHARAGDYVSADAATPALYFGLFDEGTRRSMASAVARAGLLAPWPMRTREGAWDAAELPFMTRLLVPSYHSTVWLHLGAMHVVGLKRLGLPFADEQARFERVAIEHGNFLETLDANGTPHASAFLATEYGFSMSAGLYLELVEGA